MPKPTLLILASTYPRWAGDHEPGFVHELAKRLVIWFVVVSLVPSSPGAAAREILDGVQVVRYRYAPRRLETLVNDGGIVTNLRRHKWKALLVPGFFISCAWHAWRIFRAGRTNIVHAHWLIPQGLTVALLSVMTRNVPRYVVTSHGADLYALRGPLFDMLKRLVVRRAAKVVVVSAAMRQEMQRIGVPAGLVDVQPMGVDLSGIFSPDSAVERSRCEILFVGRLVEKKGLNTLITAMRPLLERVPDATLTIAGFGPEELALKGQVERLDLSDRIRFLGGVQQVDLPHLYRRAAVFVAPFMAAESGDQEGLGLVLVEALGCGCPVVASDLPATRDVLQGDTGYLVVPSRNVEALSAAVATVLENPDRFRAGAALTRTRIVERFDWPIVSARYAKLLGAHDEVA